MGALSARLPAISAALVLQTIGLEIFRDQFGAAACNTRGIGADRRRLGHMPPDAPLAGCPPMELARDEARVLLAGICDVCKFKRCKMKLWDIMPPSG